MSRFQSVMPSADLVEGQPKAVIQGNLQLLLVRLEGRVFAVENLCTHDDVPLSEGTCEAGEIVCPRHGARFCLRTGEVLSPPAFQDLRSFAVRELEGRIEVEI